MTRERKEDRKPHKLTEFFPFSHQGGRQDGARMASTPACSFRSVPHPSNTQSRPSGSPESTHSCPDTPQSASPAKSRFRLEEPHQGLDLETGADSGDDTRELPDRIETFPTSNQPIMDTVLKDMLLSLRSTIQADMMSCMKNVRADIQEVETRVEHIETKMGEFATTINDLVDAQEQGEDEMEGLKAKLADLEDRNRRNNLKIRGVPESVSQGELKKFASTLFLALIPELTAIDITIDRIHRLPKPSYLPDNVPRDIILRMHFFHVKDQLMTTMRNKDQVPSQYQHLQFYADLSQYTLAKRRGLVTITKALRNHQIPYKWGFPTKLTVTKDGKNHVMTSLDNGLALLREWQILPETESTDSNRGHPRAVSQDWKKVTAKNSKTHA